jgi:hypothetical protein
MSSQGEVLGPEVTLDESPNGIGAGDLEFDQRGHSVATWVGNCKEPLARCDVLAQAFGLNWTRKGPPIVVTDNDNAGPVRSAVAPNGRFLVVWMTPGANFAEDSFDFDVHGQFFTPAGKRSGGELLLGPTVEFGQFFPEASADSHGNFLAVWASFRRENGNYGWDILGQLFRADGTRVSREFRVNTRNTFNEFPKPQAAFGGNATFVVVWNASDGDFDGVYGQRFMASLGDEPCLFSGGVFRCDAGRTGGEAELQLAFGRRPGEVPLLGDVDGDGREDPCAYALGNLRCDLDHRGERAEFRLTYGDGALPLFLADVNGDGKAEACLRNGNRFLCDTAHDGGAAEQQLTFGLSTDAALLGDLDGDRRDDVCVFRGGQFRCDTAQDGGSAEVRIAFGLSGDTPLIGDMDGDGREDPCVFRAGALLCDTAHDGGAAELELQLDDVSHSIPLLGNVDGL